MSQEVGRLPAGGAVKMPAGGGGRLARRNLGTSRLDSTAMSDGRDSSEQADDAALMAEVVVLEEDPAEGGDEEELAAADLAPEAGGADRMMCDETSVLSEIHIERESSPDLRTVLRVETVEDRGHLFCVRLSTNHYAYSLKRSCTLRRLNDFYALERILKTLHPYARVPSLPVRPLMWMYSRSSRLKCLATFLTLVLSERSLLSNRGLHLFVQTQLSMEIIQQNLRGHRDDQVYEEVFKDDREHSKKGFQELFGKSCKSRTRLLHDKD